MCWERRSEIRCGTDATQLPPHKPTLLPIFSAVRHKRLANPPFDRSTRQRRSSECRSSPSDPKVQQLSLLERLPRIYWFMDWMIGGLVGKLVHMPRFNQVL
ncbi:hypothetical protein N7468_008254 [Penicillium chermesinum]|uniref:Uncharacterized protein n=1 Tax=Penicillium chermesinum TaxID=63820 RepID=A0A9W9TI42_9EURO|nr:uncharacterized protein N7468_008254 [Penicillium chermesinum]KAJ5223712.1 hypothetical protein N7468_008254 [Penicillium chermesinum]